MVLAGVLISLPEVGYAVAEDVIGGLVAVGALLYDAYDFLSRLVGQRLPQTGHHATGYGRGKGGAVGRTVGSGGVKDTGLTATGHNVGLDAAVLRRADGTERGVESLGIDSTHGEHVAGIARRCNLLPRIAARVSGAAHQHYALPGQHRGCMRDERYG